MKLKLSLFALLGIGIFACNKDKVTTTKDGDRIIYHERGTSGKLAHEGDIIRFDMIIKTSKDSVLNNTFETFSTITDYIRPRAFKGSFESALYHIAEGDSATVLVPVDSMFAMMNQPVPAEFGPGTDLKFIVKMHKIRSREEIEKEINENLEKQGEKIAEYVEKNMKGALKTEEGNISYVITEKGTGDFIKDGDQTTVKYVGKFLNGETFDSGEGLSVVLGARMVIPGWEIALKQMKKGSKGTFVIPSDMAYGENGAGPIEPHTPLVFDMEVVDVKTK